MADKISRCFACGKPHEIDVEVTPMPEGRGIAGMPNQQTLGFTCPDTGRKVFVLMGFNEGEPAPVPEEQPTPEE